MKLLEMMDFVLILVIAMMSGSSLTLESRISIDFMTFFIAMAEKDSARVPVCPVDILSVKASRQLRSKDDSPNCLDPS